MRGQQASIRPVLQEGPACYVSAFYSCCPVSLPAVLHGGRCQRAARRRGVVPTVWAGSRIQIGNMELHAPYQPKTSIPAAKALARFCWTAAAAALAKGRGRIWGFAASNLADLVSARALMLHNLLHQCLVWGRVVASWCE